ncbi:hypothetical protein [Metabacillus sp. SLBN-84]
MDTALLYDEEVNIVFELWEHQKKGHSQQEAKSVFEEKYRNFSRKKAFKCLCCGTSVKIVLPNEHLFSFSHFDKRECSYSENYRTYNQQKSKHENRKTHDLGKTLIRTFIEAQLKLFHSLNLALIEGYKFKSRLGIVPDFILELPDGTIWALDFLTGLKTSKQYSDQIEKRKALYTEHGFKPFFFIDQQWLAYNESVSPHTTLVEAEAKLLMKTRQDQEWQDEYYSIHPEEQNYIQDTMGIRHFSVVSLAYFNPVERSCTILRLVKRESGDFDYYVVGKPVTLSLERALTVDFEENLFTLHAENEGDLIKDYQEHIVTEYIQHLKDIESKKQEELERQREKERLEQFNHPETYHQAELEPYSNGTRDYKQQVTAYLLKDSGIKNLPFNLEKKEKELKDKREKLLNKSVVGESYIRSGPDRPWKDIVIRFFFPYILQRMDIDAMVKEIQGSGATFTQKQKNLIEHPIESFIDAIKKELKIRV